MVEAIACKLRSRARRCLARAKDPSHAARLAALGAVNVIPEAVEASLQLAGRVLEALGLPEDAVERRIDQARAEELGRSPRNWTELTADCHRGPMSPECRRVNVR